MTYKRTIALAFACLSASTLLTSTRSTYADLLLGDLALIGYRANLNDEFSVLALNPIALGEVFYFTDAAVAGTTIGLPEALFSVTTTTAMPAGTILRFTDIGFNWSAPNANLSFVTTGPYSTGSPTASFTPFTDQVLLFDSSDGGATEAASTNLFAIDHLATAPRGLAEGAGKITRNVQDLRYTGTQTGTPETLFAAISDIDNWSSLTSASAGATSFHSSYNITAVPEPSAFLYLLVILGGVRLGFRFSVQPSERVGSWRPARFSVFNRQKS